MQTPILEVSNLKFGFNKEKTLLNDISFKINEGEFCLIAGENGSGKSLLLKCLKGLLKPLSGQIIINNQDVSKKTKERRKLLGLVFQDADSQIVGQTVEKDILFGMENIEIDKLEQEKRLKEVSALLNLEDKLKQRPRILSGGEKRRLAIAGILAMEPKIIFMDEPFANLDYPGVVQVIKTLLLLKEKGHTIIIVSHEVEKVAAHVDSLILLKEGKLIAHDKCPKLLNILRENGVYVPTINGLPTPIEEMTWLKH